MLLADLVPLVQAQQGAIYQLASDEVAPHTEAPGRIRPARRSIQRIPLGMGLAGNVLSADALILSDVPDEYTRISPSLGEAPRTSSSFPCCSKDRSRP